MVAWIPIASVAAAVVVAGKLLQRKVRYGSLLGREKRAPVKDMSGKVCLVTGANSGIGRETAKTLAQWGATVIMGCRSLERSKAAIAEVERATQGHPERVIYLPLDLASLASVRAFVDEVEKRRLRVDVLINNAGIATLPSEKTADGFATMFGVNHLAHYLLTLLLLKKRLMADDGRIVVLSSAASGFDKLDFNDLQSTRFGSSMMQQLKAYGNSKLCNALFAMELDRRLKAVGSRIVVVSVHPGAVQTDLGRDNALKKFSDYVTSLFFKSAEYGAQTSLWAATADFTGGEYLEDCRVSRVPNKQAYDIDIQRRLWEESARLLREDAMASPDYLRA